MPHATRALLPLLLTATLALHACGDKDDDDVADFDNSDDSDDSGGDGGDGGSASDADEDGFSVADGDCDDQNATVYPGADDDFGDGTDQDCDGTDGVDDDADGWASAQSGGPDCDDDDASLGSIDEDGDCDGTLTGADCDDGDATTYPGASDSYGDGTDQNCDGTDGVDDDGDGWASTDSGGSDCDDDDPELGSTADDGDCDGFPRADDCDDSNPLAAELDGDADCDGVPTAEDCDDGDPGLLAMADDGDCDGVPSASDCDDGDRNLGATYGGSRCMRRIEASTFDMGCTPSQLSTVVEDFCMGADEVMTVTLTNDYWIGETEVTQGEWSSVMGTSPSHHGSCGSDCPVEDVDWSDAAAFANALSSAAGLTECYSCTASGSEWICTDAENPYTCDGFRLPTEAEWEGAARCGEDLPFAGSSSRGSVAWYDENSGDTPHRVATKSANACDLYDMSGNVWEWAHDWYGSTYYSRFRTDPAGPAREMEGGRVVRGGGFNGSSLYVSLRSNWRVGQQEEDRGFRVARTAR